MTDAPPRNASGSPLPLLDAVLRWRMMLVTITAVVAHVGSLRTLDDGGTDWTFFTWAAQALAGSQSDFYLNGTWFPGDAPGGFSLYANYPFLQIGPPPILLATLLRLAPAEGLYLASALVVGVGLFVTLMLDRAFDDGTTARRLTLLIGGAASAVSWVFLARFVHLDDAMTLAAAVAACLAVHRERWAAVGLLAGLAATSKPWGIVAIALALAAPTWRIRALGVVAALSVIVAFWGPFLFSDLGTLALGGVRLRVTPDSVPALLGIDAIATGGPLRLLQMCGGLAISSVLVLRGRWQVALAAAFAWRLLLDPAPYPYYFAGLVTAALLVDLTVLRCPAPLLSLGVLTTMFAAMAAGDATVQGVLHLSCFGGVFLLCLTLAFYRGSTTARRMPAILATAAAPS